MPPVSTLAIILFVVCVLIGIRVALYKWLKLDVEPYTLPVETTTQQVPGEVSQDSPWPVVILLCIVVTAIASLMLYGHVLAGG